MGAQAGQGPRWPCGSVEELGLLVLHVPFPARVLGEAGFSFESASQSSRQKDLKARVVTIITFLTPSLPNAPPSGIRVHGQHRADQSFLHVLLQLEVVEGLLEDRGLVHICDIDGDPGLVSGGDAA